MLRWTRYLMLVVAFMTAFVILAPEAEARRLGGGRSFGKPAGSLFKRAPATPAKQNAASGAAGQGAAAGGRSGMMGMVGGLAAGLGLAWLASSLGFGEELANLMMILLMVAAGVFLLRWFMSRSAAARQGAGLRPAAAGAGAGAGAGAAGFNRDHSAANNVAGLQGQRPAGAAGSAGTPLNAAADQNAAPAGPFVPAGFDTEGFLRQAKVQFIRLQAVYDAGDLADLATFTAPEVFGELKLDINERAGADNQTDVVQLDAEMLGVDEEGDDYFASVHFSGLIREAADASAEPFSEIWLLSKPRSGNSGWVLAGIQQDDSPAS